MPDLKDVLAATLKEIAEGVLKKEAEKVVNQETEGLTVEERLRRVEIETAVNTAKHDVVEKHLQFITQEYTAFSENTLNTAASFLFLGVSKYLNRQHFTPDEIDEILNDASERQIKSFGDEAPPKNYILNFAPFVEDAVREFVAKKG